MGKDLRFGFRILARSPWFTLMAVAALALGIGANTAIFSVVNAVMLQRLPFHDPARLVMVWEKSPRSEKPNVVNSNNFLAWRERNHSFERIAALINYEVIVTGDGEPEMIRNLAVSDGFFEMLGTQPLLGRWFTAKEDTPGNDRVAILGERLWRRRYGSDPNVLGRTIQVNGRALTIVGVMPADFGFPQTRADLWQPMALDPKRISEGRSYSTIARLRSGASLASAQADMDVIAAQLQKERPGFDSQWGIVITGLRERAIGDVRTPLLVLLGAVGLVLLIACANVANLMLIRAAGRGREVAIRAALGASAARIARQLLVESSLLALAGGAAGLLLGQQAMTLLVAALPDTIAYANLKTIHLDTAVFAFTLGISLLTGILFGLAPAIKASRTDVQAALRDGGRSATAARSFTRQALVVAEVALAMILLAGGGLLLRSFARLTAVDPGFDARHVLSMRVAGVFRSRDQLLGFDREMLDRVRALPGVEAAGTSHFLPLGNVIPGTGFWREDRPRPKFGDEPVTEVLVVMPGYFSAMGIPVLRGRVFDERDNAGVALHSVVVNQALAREFYSGEDPVGKILRVQWGPTPDAPYEIAGVVGDVHQEGLDHDVKAEVFLSNLQEPTGPIYLVARIHGDPNLLAKSIQSAIHAVNKDAPISEVKTMDRYVSSAVAAPRFNAILLGGFAALALVLAAVGIFGVISYSVTQRTQEIGIRRALGAESGEVMRLVLGQAMRLAAIGIVAGLAGALALTRVMQTLLFGITPEDPATFAAVAALVALTASAASYLPARRAVRVDPMEALRHE